MKQVIDFLNLLARNNDKAWFDAHKQDYLQAKDTFDAFAMRMVDAVAEFDPRVAGLALKDVTYRIYRDVRFSNDKRPYKWHMGVYVCPGGKKSGMAGYYVHIEPVTGTYFVCGGLYNPDKLTLHSIREEIMLEPEGFHKAVEQCKGFNLPWESALKRMPKGYNEADPHSEYYRLRSFEIYHPITLDDALAPDFVERAAALLRRSYDFTELLNRCFDYAHDPESDIN